MLPAIILATMLLTGPPAAGDATAAPGRSIAAGATVAGTLEPAAAGAARAQLSFSTPVAGAVTFELSSRDFDAQLRVRDGDGNLVGEDNDSGIETDAVLVLHARSGASYVIEVSAPAGQGGEYELACVAGIPPPLAGAAALDAAIEFRSDAGDRARLRGDKSAEARHRLALGHLLSVTADYERAAIALNAALVLARDVGDARMEIEILNNLGYCHLGRGDSAGATGSFEAEAALARLHDLAWAEKDALRILTGLYLGTERDADARKTLTRELEIARAGGDKQALEYALDNLAGFCHLFEGFAEEMVLRKEQSLLAKELGGTAFHECVCDVARCHLALGETESARDLAETVVAEATRGGDPSMEAQGLEILGLSLSRIRSLAVDARRAQVARCCSRLEALLRSARANAPSESEIYALHGLFMIAEEETVELPVLMGATRDQVASDLLEVARRDEEDRFALQVLESRARRAAARGERATARDDYTEALRIARSLGARPAVARITVALDALNANPR